MLHHGGIKNDNIVVMMANDIAGNYQNPHPGKIFNSPGGPDVYDGVPVVSGSHQDAHAWLATATAPGGGQTPLKAFLGCPLAGRLHMHGRRGPADTCKQLRLWHLCMSSTLTLLA